MPTWNPIVTDGLENLTKRIGGTDDPAYNTRFVARRLTPIELDSLYTDGSLAGKVIDIPIDDAMSKGRYIKEDALSGDEIERFEDYCASIDYYQKITNALKWARLYGGAVILIGVRGDDYKTPLNDDMIKAGSLEYLTAIDCTEVAATVQQITDPTRPNYRKAEYYMIGGVTVHYSRVVVFDGIDVPYRLRDLNNGFGLSMIQRLYDDVYRAEHSAQSADALLFNAANDVVKIPGLLEMLASDGDGETSALVTRLSLANAMRNNISMMVLDANEDFIRTTQTFSGIVDLVRQNLEKLAASADIPATRLLGQSPNGLNATGESDTGNYHDVLRSIQRQKIKPNMMRLDKIILRHLGIKTDGYCFDFNPLSELSATQVADLELKNAQRDLIYADRSLVTPEIIARQLREEGTYSALDDDYLDALSAMVRETPTDGDL